MRCVIIVHKMYAKADSNTGIGKMCSNAKFALALVAIHELKEVKVTNIHKFFQGCC